MMIMTEGCIVENWCCCRCQFSSAHPWSAKHCSVTIAWYVLMVVMMILMMSMMERCIMRTGAVSWVMSVVCRPVRCSVTVVMDVMMVMMMIMEGCSVENWCCCCC